MCEPLGHGLVEADFVAVVVGQFEDNVLHEVEHDHLEEVVLFEGLGEDDLAGDAAVLVAALLDHFVLAREQVLARPRVEHCDHRLGVAHVPVLALDVTHLDDVRAADPDHLRHRADPSGTTEERLHWLPHGIRANFIFLDLQYFTVRS